MQVMAPELVNIGNPKFCDTPNPMYSNFMQLDIFMTIKSEPILQQKTEGADIRVDYFTE